MRYAVVGDVCQDVFVYGKCNRLCPEAPVPVFMPIAKNTNLGMAGNVYNNMRALGVDAKLFGNNDTIIKTRYIENKSNQMIMRLDTGEDDPVERISMSMVQDIQKYDVVIISDYCKGFLNQDDIRDISTFENISFMDTKKLLGDWCDDVDFIKINQKEFDENRKHNPKWVDNNLYKIIVTLGGDGVMYDGHTFPMPESIQTIDISGAGDTFMCGFVYEFMKQYNDDKYCPHIVSNAIKFAQKCSLSAVKQRGISCIEKA